jgi:hypothetical protein
MQIILIALSINSGHMKQEDKKHLKENITCEDTYVKNFPDHTADEIFAKGKTSIQENDSIKIPEELLAPYYDEFHFANYE